jgi:hypothetical protein
VWESLIDRSINHSTASVSCVHGKLAAGQLNAARMPDSPAGAFVSARDEAGVSAP